MDRLPKISCFQSKNTADLTALVHEIFQDEFEKETISWHLANNLTQSSRGCSVQEQFSMDVSNVITAHQAVMNEIEYIEAELIDNVLHWISQNEKMKEYQRVRNMLRIKNKSLFVDLKDSNITKKYHLLCSRDYLPEKHECIVDFQINEKLQSWIKEKSPQNNSIQPSYIGHDFYGSSVLKKLPVITKKSSHSMSGSRSHSLHKKSVMKIDFYKTVLIAEPHTVKFHNFNIGVQYQKCVLLKNVGSNIAKFQIQQLDNPRFSITQKTTNGDRQNIAPGMNIKIGINFCTDNPEDIEEHLMINVQHARSLIIKIVGYRDPPKLTGFIIRLHPKYDHPEHFSTKCQNDFYCDRYPNALSDESVEDDEDISDNVIIAGSTIECRKGFVGEFILVLTKVKNVGYSGEFFIMSEIDWCMMQVNDVMTSNIILLPSFAIWPVYFSLLHDEVLEIFTFFYPQTYGLQVDKLYIICNNYSCQPVELIGDGILYDSEFICFGKNLEENVAKGLSHFILDLGICPENTIIENQILVSNNRLFIEDIPVTALPKNEQFYIQPSKTKRRTCYESVDIWIGKVEIRLQCIILNLTLPVKETEKTYTINEMKEQELSETIVEDKKSPKNVCCKSEEEFLEPDIINAQNLTPAIICPGRPLYSNVEETFLIIVHNLSCKSAPFEWGKPSGSDDSKMEIFFDPKSGEIPPRTTKLLEIRCLPLKPGKVKDLFLPCHMGASKIQKTLRIECTIETMSVTFYFPGITSFHGSSNKETLCIHWEALSVSALHKNISEERELRTVHLDPGNVLKEVSLSTARLEDTIIEPDQNVEEELEESRESKPRSWNDLLQGIIWSKDHPEEHIQLVNPHAVVPFHKTILPAIPHPVVIEFLELPLHTVRKETFVIRNETPISAKFSMSVKNFDLVREIPTELKSAEERILDTYFNVMTGESVGMKWYKGKQAGSGVVLVIYPLHGGLGPYEAIKINILAYADTWGTYTDEVTVNIIGLPIYTFGVCVQVTQSPICYPICRSLKQKYPLIRFGDVKYGSKPLTRKVQVENNSILPFMINWHCFLHRPAFHLIDKPFNLVLDLYTPFVDRDITMQDCHSKGGHSISKILRNPELYDSTESTLKCENANSISSSFSLISGFTEYPTTTITDISFNNAIGSMSQKNEEKDGMKNYIGKFAHLFEGSQDATHKDTNIQLSLIPYYGQVDYHVFSVSPQEMFIPAKSKRWLTITMIPDKHETSHSDSKIYGKALGFIRIAPMHKYKADCFSRSDGYFFLPTEIQFEGNLINPRLQWDIPKSERVFIFYAASIIQHFKQQMQIKRRYIFRNQFSDSINVNIVTMEPFSVARIFTQKGCTMCGDADYIILNPEESVEVEILCTLSASNIKRLMDYGNSRENSKLSVDINRTLQIIHTGSCTQLISSSS
ncbi:uncharacterized protein LOC107267982 [Cephus cinctus]|uniref:Uncharacterized protein LOC107267982 n=1 Tax=Cephus cinctus TaxID=211228 RepID=A0AAJ7W1J3_CEPCN|nr:uncharacterized protein LOC107267982 [Cephus cinctus]